jgi:hypothetical protein
MPSVDKKEDMRKTFPGDKALHQIHLARRSILALPSERE